MLLSSADLERMRKEPPRDCLGCGTEVKRNYCRDCDVFFFDGHGHSCTDTDARAHRAHRTYRDFSITMEDDEGTKIAAWEAESRRRRS